MPSSMRCSSCGLQFSYLSSEIGTLRACSRCGHETRVPIPTDVQAQLEEREREQAEWNAKWGKHDHIQDPQPFQDINGFFDAVRAFAARHGLAMAGILAPAGVFGIPATEHYGETLQALRRVPAEELEQLPPQLQTALLQVQRELERYFGR